MAIWSRLQRAAVEDRDTWMGELREQASQSDPVDPLKRPMSAGEARSASSILDFGSHALTHSSLTSLSSSAKVLEIQESRIRVGATVEIGDGAFLAAGSIAIADATIGRGVILNTACSVDHDCVIGDGVHLGPGVRLCGNVSIGARSLVGVGSAIRPGIKIGSDVVVGAGSAVVADIPNGSIYAGCPARALG